MVDPKHFNEYIIFVICCQFKSRHVESIQDFFNNKIMRPIIESVSILKVFEIINPSLHPWYHLWEVEDLNFVCLKVLMHQRIFTYHYGIFLKNFFAIFLKCIFFCERVTLRVGVSYMFLGTMCMTIWIISIILYIHIEKISFSIH